MLKTDMLVKTVEDAPGAPIVGRITGIRENGLVHVVCERGDFHTLRDVHVVPVDSQLGSKEGQALRYNASKVEMDRLPLDCLVEVAKVLQASSKKYPDNPDGTHNWEKLWDKETDKVLRGCIMRHLTEIQKGEDLDRETELSHYAHIACNALFGIRYHLNKEKERATNKISNINGK